MGDDERKVGIAFEDTTVDHTGDSGGGVIDESYPQWQLELIHVVRAQWQHRVLYNGYLTPVDCCPHGFQVRMVKWLAPHVGANCDADQAQLVQAAIEFRQRSFGVA